MARLFYILVVATIATVIGVVVLRHTISGWFSRDPDQRGAKHAQRSDLEPISS